ILVGVLLRRKRGDATHERWVAFCRRLDENPPFAELLALIRREPSSGLRRSFVIHLARLERELVSDAQLEQLAAMFEGKVPAYVAGALIVRRLRRGDPTAIADALTSGQAFVQVALLDHAPSP